MREIAERFGVAEVSVKKASERERWGERRAGIEERARKTVDRRAEKSAADRIRENLQLIQASKLVYARGLQSGKQSISAAEMAALMKVEAVLTGGASERIAGESEGGRRSLEAIEAELAELDPEHVDAMLAADQVVEARVRELPERSADPLDARDSEPVAVETAVVAPLATGEDEEASAPVDEPSRAEKASERGPYEGSLQWQRYADRVLNGGGR